MRMSIIKKEFLIIVATSLFAIGYAGCNENKETGKIKSETGNVKADVKNVFTDSRDGKTYKTVKIGKQIWMAENLNFETEDSYCYNDSAEYCTKYGRLYTWKAAQGVCPTGWHLPTMGEFETLIKVVGGKDVAGKNLKFTSGWKNDLGVSHEDHNGTDAFGFSALPAGFHKYNERDEGYFYHAEVEANFWSSTESDSDYAYCLDLESYYEFVGDRPTELRKMYELSVRCLKD